MGRYAGDTVAVIIGAALIVFNRRWAEFQVGAQNRTWGFRMGPRAVAMSRFVSFIVGAGFVVAGVLGLLGIANPRN